MSADQTLKDAVVAELKWRPHIAAAHIGVTARGGVIALTGHVKSLAEKEAAHIAAAEVRGVTAVSDEIEVSLPTKARRSDAEIAEAAINRLAWDAALPRDSVKVTVENSWITLRGEVPHRFEREAAQEDVRGLWGVLGVSNEIALTRQVSLERLAEDISTALRRSWLGGDKIKVDADGSSVTLTGAVASWSARELAGTTALSTPGVTEVVNKLIIA
jgi:osmotically-inducible protein OsmY